MSSRPRQLRRRLAELAAPAVRLLHGSPGAGARLLVPGAEVPRRPRQLAAGRPRHLPAPRLAHRPARRPRPLVALERGPGRRLARDGALPCTSSATSIPPGPPDRAAGLPEAAAASSSTEATARRATSRTHEGFAITTPLRSLLDVAAGDLDARPARPAIAGRARARSVTTRKRLLERADAARRPRRASDRARAPRRGQPRDRYDDAGGASRRRSKQRLRNQARETGHRPRSASTPGRLRAIFSSASSARSRAGGCSRAAWRSRCGSATAHAATRDLDLAVRDDDRRRRRRCASA